MSGLTGIIGETSNAAGAEEEALIKDSSMETFGADVIEVSETTPVIVDFWAPWCGPCKTLGPMLEAAVAAAGGKVKMVKVDIDQNQELAAQLRIQSVPTVYGFYQGRPVDGFQGAVPQSQITEFVSKMADLAGPSSEEEMIEAALAEAATAVEAGNTNTAAAIYQQILGSFPENVTALAGFLSILIADDRLDEAETLLSHSSDDIKSKPEIKAIVANIALLKDSPDTSALNALKVAYESNPDDHESGLELAKGLAAQQDKEQAVEVLLQMIARDREWNEQAARKQLVEFFQVFGMTDPVTVAGRRKLSSLLFS